MQGKGVVKFFLIVLTLVCAVQYMFILPTNKVENAAEEYAERKAEQAAPDRDEDIVAREARTRYLDSMSDEEILNIPMIKAYTYEELKQQQLALGLDLKGGMSVILQVNLRDFIENLANDSQDPTFQQALDNAAERLQQSQSGFVTLFADEWNELSGEDEKLAPIFLRNPAFRDDINYETSDGEVISLIRDQAAQTVDLTYSRLKDRIDKFGVTQPNVSLDAARDLIIVELPGVDNPQRARNFLQATAKLEFWNVYRITDPGVRQGFLDADERLRELKTGDTTGTAQADYRIDTTYEAQLDTNGNVVDSIMRIDTVPTVEDPMTDRGPLLSKINLNSGNQQQRGYSFPLAVMGTVEKNQRKAVMEMLRKPEIKAFFPRDIKFLYSDKPMVDYQTGEETDRFQLYAIKKGRGEEAPLQGDRIVEATAQPDPVSGEVAVTLKMDQRGARIWGDMTTKAAQDNSREIAIVLDNEVVSAPRVNEPIMSGNSQITGNFTTQEAQDLANILEVGKLPAKTQIIQESLVGPSLGEDNINASMNSLLIGFGLVLLFMILYYGSAGIVSIIALFANLFFIFGALASYGTVLTLPGIAGIVLTIGMAVDANVIIFERVREELREGKSMMMSISDGFQNSYSAIIDANVTTLLTAFILAYFGLGPIKGFAVVLIIGVLSSLFTAVLFGRLMIDYWTERGNKISFWNGWSKNMLANLNIDWLGKRKIAYVISAIIIVAGIGSYFTRGFDLGVDFKGGYSYSIQFEEDQQVEATELRESLTPYLDGTPVVKVVSATNTFNVTTSYLINETGEGIADSVTRAVHKGVNEVVARDVPYEEFNTSDGEGTRVISLSKVGPTIAEDIKTSAYYATVFALLLIFLYIFIRFSKWQYSLGAVSALFHDTLVVLAIFSLLHGIVPFSIEIDQAFVAALLTVIGYSINDTVVVFDRVREYLNTYLKKSKKDTINAAINSTLSRTVITSVTTLFVVAILLVFGGGSIKGFAFALFIGIIVGTYSSVFIATPIMTDLTGEIKPKKAGKKSFSRAMRK